MNQERCDECNEKLYDEDFHDVAESRGKHMTEIVRVGYDCKNCGHYEEY